MATSNKTAEQIVFILVDEIGVEKTKAILDRLQSETEGNASYKNTLSVLHKILTDQAKRGTLA